MQPDITVVCDRRKLDKYGCVGNPDLIIEIISQATRKKDMNQKRHAYEQSGVPEYWVVWPETQTVMVFMLNEKGCYHSPTVYERDDHVQVSVLPGLVIDLATIFTEEEDSQSGA